MLIHISIGIGVGAAAAFLSMLLCAFVLTLSDFNASVAVPLSNICLAIGSAAGGFTASMLHRSKGLIIGAAVGFIMFALVTLISLIASGSSMTANTPLRLVVMTLIAAVGGIIGVNRAAKHKMM